MNRDLTDKDYWEKGYRQPRATAQLAIDPSDFRQFPHRRLVERVGAVGLAGKEVLELGAGDSSVLLSLAHLHGHEARFSGLDYAEPGCDLLRSRSRDAAVDIEVIHADMFKPPAPLRGRFDVIYSVGVMEHFTDLATTMAAVSAFAKPGGTVLTIIPNLSGALGWMTRHANPAVYALHNPHDLASLVDGHARAGLRIRESGYVCSTHFGVLGACFPEKKGFGWMSYALLARLSMVLWYFESRWGELPKTRAFAPYIYVVAERGK